MCPARLSCLHAASTVGTPWAHRHSPGGQCTLPPQRQRGIKCPLPAHVPEWRLLSPCQPPFPAWPAPPDLLFLGVSAGD